METEKGTAVRGLLIDTGYHFDHEAPGDRGKGQMWRSEAMKFLIIGLGVIALWLWWLWRKAIVRNIQLREDIWSQLIERELVRSNELATTVYKGQVSLNSDYLSVLHKLEQMRSEVAKSTYEVWKLEIKCKQQQAEIDKLGGTVLSRPSVYRPN
jgi:hypothetical protein